MLDDGRRVFGFVVMVVSEMVGLVVGIDEALWIRSLFCKLSVYDHKSAGL